MSLSSSLFGFVVCLKQHFPLIFRMIKREVIGRYRGSFFGLLWSFITPIIMLSIYTFVFSFVFKARWGIESSDPYEFAVMLFSGLIVFNLFAESITRAPSLILNNVNYVKKVIFPLEILPWVSLGSAVFHALISFLVLFLFLAILGHPFSLAMLWLPIILLPFLLLVMGLSWFLASLGVFVRDIGQVIGMLMTVFMFMCPIFYPLSALPESIAQYLYLNPLTLIVDQVRTVLITAGQPDWLKLGYYSLISVFCAWSGWFLFIKTRKGFADVL
jgi:lipopolysaccharide transport system permease protein